MLALREVSHDQKATSVGNSAATERGGCSRLERPWGPDALSAELGFPPRPCPSEQNGAELQRAEEAGAPHWLHAPWSTCCRCEAVLVSPGPSGAVPPLAGAVEDRCRASSMTGLGKARGQLSSRSASNKPRAHAVLRLRCCHFRDAVSMPPVASTASRSSQSPAALGAARPAVCAGPSARLPRRCLWSRGHVPHWPSADLPGVGWEVR